MTTNKSKKNDSLFFNFSQILNRLRSQLLDLTARNRLVKFKYTRRSLRFVDIGIDDAYKALDEDNILKLQYVPLPPEDEITNYSSPEKYSAYLGLPTSYDLTQSTKFTENLQTLLYPKELERTIKIIREENRSATEESGNHILFLAAGFLSYTLPQGSHTSEYLAPLLFKPVQLDRGNIDQVSGLYTYYLKSLDTDEEIRDNITLREKLNHELGFQLPVYEEGLKPSEYLQIISDACGRRKGWKVHSHLSLVLLSFKSLALWADLDPIKDDNILQNSLIKKLFGEEETNSPCSEGIAEEYSIDEHTLAEIPLIYDADSSQHSALIDALEGKNLVVIGPPGTGKSQTITNLIAIAMSRGKNILFVSEKKAALDVVAKRIEGAGLGLFCLELHSNKSNKKRVLDSIEKRLNQSFPPTKNTINEDVQSLRNMRQKLNAYARLINQVIDIPGKLTIHDILWKLDIARQSLENNVEVISRVFFSKALSWGNEDVENRRQILANLSLHYTQLKLKPLNHPLQGLILNSLSPISKYQLEQLLEDGLKIISAFLSSYDDLPNGISQNPISYELNISWQEILKNLQPSSPINEDLLIKIGKSLTERSSDEIKDALNLLQNLKINFTEADKLFLNSNRHLIENFPLVPSQIEHIPISYLNNLSQNFTAALSKIRTIFSSAPIEHLEKLVSWLQLEKHKQFKTLTLEEVSLLSKRLSKLLNRSEFTLCKKENNELLTNLEAEQLLNKAEDLNNQLTLGLESFHLLREELMLSENNMLDLDLFKTFNEILDLAPKMFFAIRSLHNNFDSNQSSAEDLIKAAKLIEEQKELSSYLEFASLLTTKDLENHLQHLYKSGFYSFFSRRYYSAKKYCKNLFKQIPSKNIFFEKLNQLLNWCKEKDTFLSCSSKRNLYENCFSQGSKEQENLENLINWQNNTTSLIRKKNYGHTINFFSISDKALQSLNENKEKILELIQINTDFQKYLSVLEPFYQKILALNKLSTPLITISSISFNEIIETAKHLITQCADLKLLGNSVNNSTNFGELETVLNTRLGEIEPILQICQSIAPISMTPRQIQSSIQAIKRIEKKIPQVYANRILSNSTVSFDKSNNEQNNLEIALIWALELLETKLPFLFKRALLAEPNKSQYFYEVLQKQLTSMQNWKEIILRIEEICTIDHSLWFVLNKENHSFNEINALKNRFKKALETIENIDPWIIYNKCRENGLSLDLSDLIHLLEEEVVIPTQLVSAFDYIFYHTHINYLYKQFPDLAMINGYNLDNLKHQFCELDRKLIRLNGIKLATNISQRDIPKGRRSAKASDLTELALLKHEIEKTRRHISIRKLMSQARNAIQALKPCLLMSPLSVAQYLPKSGFTFDLLIIDEASQMRLPEALSAILRSKQVIVVGDPKQLPPSNFFEQKLDRSEEEEEETGSIEDGAQSILERCLQVFNSPRYLRWHYRSQDHNLIAFSNYHFYDNRLIILPACHQKNAKAGVFYNYVFDSNYKNRTNIKEAEKLIEAVISQLLSDASTSVGIATLNQPQRDIIIELFDQKLRELPLLREAVDKFELNGEDVFIKNLENVQGDERDIIYISTVYGQAAGTSVVRQTFGPINGSSGWRRLNVLFTRARLRIELYTSMQPEDIILNKNSSLGLQILRHYLTFARDGQLGPINSLTGEVESPFEESIVELLKRNGYEVSPQLGVQGYWIDIAVHHPEKPGEYLAAIECDGATYHSSRSARDRDRIRQEILESLGWKNKIYRIWSTDWFTNPAKQTSHLLDFLAELRFPEINKDFK